MLWGLTRMLLRITIPTTSSDICFGSSHGKNKWQQWRSGLFAQYFLETVCDSIIYYIVSKNTPVKSLKHNRFSADKQIITMAEEIKRPSDTPGKETKEAPEISTSGAASNADFPTLFANIGFFIDSSIESVAGMINSASSVTKQVSENITLTANSDTVKGMVDNIGALSQNVIQGVNDTLNSDELKKTFNELGNLASTVIDSAGSVARSEQAQNLFNTISTGLNQLLQTIVRPIQSGAADLHAKKAVEIPFSHKAPGEVSGPGSEPEKQGSPEIQPLQQQKKSETVKAASEKTESLKTGEQITKQKSTQPNPVEKKRTDPSRKGTIPRQRKLDT